MKYYFFTLFVVFTATFSFNAYSQSASGIGLSYGPNRPFSNDYNWGSGWQLFGDIRIGKQFEIVPNLGVESLNSKGRVYQVDPYNTKHIDNISLFYLGISAKYDFNRQFFIKAGPTLYAGGDDIAAAGIGGTVAGGYNWDLDEHSTLELSLFSTVVSIKSGGNGITPIAGFKVGYVFNFRARK